MEKRRLITEKEFGSASPRTVFLLSAAVLFGGAYLVAMAAPDIGIGIAVVSALLLIRYGGAVDGLSKS